jgi:hypothetical protein
LADTRCIYVKVLGGWHSMATSLVWRQWHSMAILPDLVQYDTELPEYNTITPYPYMNERWPGLPRVYKRPGECWTIELNISDHPPVNYDRSTKIVLMMNTIVQNAWWDVDQSCQILGICRCHLWTSPNSTGKKNVVIRWTLKAPQSIYIYPFVDYSWYISVSIHSVTCLTCILWCLVQIAPL